MRLLVFAASSSKNSINGALVKHASNRLRKEWLADIQIERIDLNDYEMPIYSIDREQKDGIPLAAQRFIDQVRTADALMVSYAEHNGSYTAAFKNVFDWASRIEMKVFQGKPMVALSTSVGRRGAASVLKLAVDSAPHFGAEVIASLSVPSFRDTFDTDRGTLRDSDLSKKLDHALGQLAARLTRNARSSPAQRPERTTASSLQGTAMWNARYAEAFEAYGTKPNDFLKAVSGQIPPGPVLVIAAGEGRDAVFLAELGHEVTAMDLSEIGLANAATLAAERQVNLTTVVADLARLQLRRITLGRHHFHMGPRATQVAPPSPRILCSRAKAKRGFRA